MQVSKNITKADYVLLSSRWYDYQLEYLTETVQALSSITDAEIILVGNKALALDSQEIATRCVLMSRVNSVNCNKSIEHLNQYAAALQKINEHLGSNSYYSINKAMKSLADESGIVMLDLYNVLCGLKLDSCTIYSEEGVASFKDKSHFNDIGTQIIAKRLKKSNFLGSGD